MLKTEAAKLGIEHAVTFTGMVSDVYKELRSCDLMLFPSVSEGFGLAVLEAQAAGKRCLVSTAVPSVADLGIGLVERLDLRSGPQAWAAKILELEEAGLEYYNSANIETAFQRKSVHIDSMVQAWINLYGD